MDVDVCVAVKLVRLLKLAKHIKQKKMSKKTEKNDKTKKNKKENKRKKKEIQKKIAIRHFYLFFFHLNLFCLINTSEQKIEFLFIF